MWSAQLERLYDDDGLRRALGYGAAVHASAFGWKRTATLTADSYQQAAEQFSAHSVR